MREILFREKRKSNGKWIEGYVFKQFVNIKDEYYIRCGDTDYLVIPETVGQYTGLTDKNGNKIFEGDIVNVLSSDTLGEMHETTIVVDDIRTSSINSWLEYADELEIIGNIHNTELMKGEWK